MKKRTGRTTKTAQTHSGASSRSQFRYGAVSVEYILLVTVLGIGVLVGLASVRDALISELEDLANAIMAIT